MKIKLVLLLCCAGSVSANPLFSQKAKYDVSYTNRTILSVLDDLKEQTGYAFLHMDGVIPEEMTVTMELKGTTIEQILDKVLVDNGFYYRIRNNDVIITRAAANVQQQPRQAQPARVAGTVRDQQGKPLAGVSVTIKGATRGISTAADGKYALSATPGQVLVFSFLGKKTVEIAYTGQQTIDVRMEERTEEVEQVVVTGMFTRRLESETGSSVQFKGDQLREVGNQNLLKSLANLDPAFMIMESIEFGSDPNRLPEIQLRGQSSFPDMQGEYAGNPNQPLFILDGFETTLQKVYDLDMNRVATVTILKDASAKAIYGSKAGNGVVVIETIRPQQGVLRVGYSGSFDVEAPDLTDYNLMTAREKLDFEKASGMYKGVFNTDNVPYGQNAMDALYQKNLLNILGGVDTYWLSQPLRVGTGQKHSLNLDGGDDRIAYGIGLSYNNVKGVMKGSERSTFSANMNFSYTYKSLIFRNTLEFATNRGDNSPYGSFSEYTRMNPYWIPYDAEGNPTMQLGEYGGIKYYNPLYNAALNVKNTSGYNEVRDNFQAEWRVLSSLRLTGRFSFSSVANRSDVFYPANHTMFAELTEENSDRKGEYTKSDGQSTSYQADLGVNFNKTIGRHIFFANGTWNVSVYEGQSHTYVAEGFGNKNMDDIAFGAKYKLGTAPAGSSNNQREVGVVGALNYSFADRYLFDASARTSGSSKFGADNKWGLFWSLGLGWNIHKEQFAQRAAWLTRLKIRGSVGYTGSQNFDPYQAKARYEYAGYTYDGSYGALILGLPNDNLRWQRVFDYNIGADISLFNRLNIKFDTFLSITDDLLINVAIPPSTGFSTYKENLGKIENRGFDTNVSYQVWRNPAQRAWLTVSVSALHNTSKIKKISNTFETRNNEQNDSKGGTATLPTDINDLDQVRKQYTRPSTLYFEGQSMTAIWGARSAGIDPQTGEEMFYDLGGKIVTVWSALNQAIIGNSAPKLRGNINLNAGWRGFTLSVACGYKLGGQMYNTTLVDRVENTDGRLNLDRRIYDSWLNPGDIKPYRKLGIVSAGQGYSKTATKPTSRFIMDDRELYISSINAGYDFQNRAGLSKVGIERLRLSFYMNELFRFSAVEVERGTSYPFARNFSFSLQATF